ncbi:MAG: PKD domain-containing protein [Raineya sp.]|jgi:PKD repeat protein|nr:PKD domain-containing protein [Raineya sp.]
MRVSILLIIYVLIFSLGKLSAQCVPNNIADFGTPPVVCPDQTFNLTNPDNTSNVTYNWNLCGDDMKTIPTTEKLLNLFGADGLLKPQLVFDNGEYFLFISSFYNGKLFRVDFGNSPNNAPQQVTDLGSFGGILRNPYGIVIEKDYTTNTWIGLMNLRFNANATFIRFNFGNSLKNTPVATNAGNLGTYNLYGFSILREGSNYYLITSDRDTKNFYVVNLGTSLNTPISTSNIVNTFNMPDLDGSGAQDFDVIESCGVWNVLMVGAVNIFHLKFTGSITTTPTYTKIIPPVDLGFGIGIKAIHEDGNFYVLVLGYDPGKLFVLDYGNSINANTPTITQVATMTDSPNNFYGLAWAYHEDAFYVFSVTLFADNIFKVKFKRNCGVNLPTENTSVTNPVGVSYRNTGTHPIILRVYDSDNNLIQLHHDSVVVNPTSTIGNFTVNPVCVGNTMSFSNTSVGSDAQVSSWSWDFGDGNTSNVKNPTHLYASSGAYNVTLTVNNANGCNNSITKQVFVSNGVNADFQNIPTTCIGQPIVFNNLSTFTNVPFDEITGFYWDFGDGTYSPFQNPTKTYINIGNYTISLTVRDKAGCTDVITKNINVLDNPLASFNFPSRICVGVPVSFASTTVNASEHLWLFEAHGTSTNANPTVTFTKSGFYDITLQVKNSNNCTSSFTVENIEVLDAPNIIFNAQKTITNLLEINFTNFSSGATFYQWDFGDGETSQETNPKHAYKQAGEYIVTLKAKTNNDCESSISQIVGVGVLQTDLAINQAILTNEKLNVELENKGNTLLNQISVEIQIGDTTFREIYPNTIALGEKVNLDLQTILPTELLSKNPYVCIKVLPKPSLQDSNVKNNQACINLSNRFTVFEPYPNPTSDNLTISFTAPNTGSVKIAFTDVVGRNINYQIVANTGYNEQSLSLKGLAKGLYVVSFEYENKVLYKKVIVQ